MLEGEEVKPPEWMRLRLGKRINPQSQNVIIQIDISKLTDEVVREIVLRQQREMARYN